MKFIFTTEEKKNARKGIDGYRQSYIIDCREFVMQFNYDELTSVSSAQDFIVNKEIEKKLTQAASNKKSGQVIYFNYKLTPELVLNVKQFFALKGITVDYYLFDVSSKHNTTLRHLIGNVI